MSYASTGYEHLPLRAGEIALGERHRLRLGDIALLEPRDLDGIDGVVNFAAETMVDQAIRDPRPFVHANVLGATRLFMLAAERGIRVLQVSTDEVYGTLAEGFATEDYPYRPTNAYSACKAAAELMAHAFHVTHGLDVVTVRMTNNYGPRQNAEKFVPATIRRILAGDPEDPVLLYGDGLHERDWLFVEDAVRGIWRVFLHGDPGETYNLGGGNLQPNIAVFELLANLLGRDPARVPVRFVPDEEIRPGHDRRYGVDASRAARELGWRPHVSLDAGMRRTAAWFRRQYARPEGTERLAAKGVAMRESEVSS